MSRDKDAILKEAVARGMLMLATEAVPGPGPMP